MGGTTTIPPMASIRDDKAKLEFEKSRRFSVTLMAILAFVVVLVIAFVLAWVF